MSGGTNTSPKRQIRHPQAACQYPLFHVHFRLPVHLRSLYLSSWIKRADHDYPAWLAFSVTPLLSPLHHTDTGAIPTSSNGDGHPPPVSRTVEYHRPTRNSAHYSPGTDMSLGMVSATASPRLGPGGVHAPSSFRSPPVASPTGFDSTAHLLPSRAAPAPPGMTGRRESNAAGTGNPDASYGAGPSRTYPKSASNSPNPNRYSAGPSGAGMVPALSASNGIPPPRPTRAGTLPLGESSMNGLSPISTSHVTARVNAAAGGISPGGGGPAYLGQPAPPPLQHQPFSAPTNPYATQGIERGMEETKIGLGMGTPMNVVEPSKEKELPNAPAQSRSRSGTGKSQKGKSIFGNPFSSKYPIICLHSPCLRRVVELIIRSAQQGEGSRHLDALRSHPPHSRWF